MMGSLWLKPRFMLLVWWLRGYGLSVTEAMWLARTCGVRIRRKTWPKGAAWSLRGEHETTAHLAEKFRDNDLKEVELVDSDGRRNIEIKSGEGLFLSIEDASTYDWEVVLNSAWWTAIVASLMVPVTVTIVSSILWKVIEQWLW